MSYKVEVNTYGDAPGVFTGNAVTHDNLGDAIDAAKDLFGRWTAVKVWQVVNVEKGTIAAFGPTG